MTEVKVEPNAEVEFASGMGRQLEESRTRRLKEDQAEREAESIMGRYILPHMPQTLYACYRVTHVNTGFGNPLSHLTLGLSPRLDMKDPEQSKVALGTVDKTVAGLKKGGWEITEYPRAKANEYSKSMTVEVGAIRSCPPSLLDKLTRRGQDSRTVTLIMQFKGVHETDRCRLVEEEVTIPEEHRPEHKETRLKVVCDDD